jgi:hypothetical protein
MAYENKIEKGVDEAKTNEMGLTGDSIDTASGL